MRNKFFYRSGQHTRFASAKKRRQHVLRLLNIFLSFPALRAVERATQVKKSVFIFLSNRTHFRFVLTIGVACSVIFTRAFATNRNTLEVKC